MVRRTYIPVRGDIVSLEFAPQAGREQTGRRPALVLSPKEYNERVGLALVCPITKQQKGYPFEVVLPKRMKIQGVVLADHVKSLDWRARRARFVERVSHEQWEDALGKLFALLQ